MRKSVELSEFEKERRKAASELKQRIEVEVSGQSGPGKNFSILFPIFRKKTEERE